LFAEKHVIIIPINMAEFKKKPKHTFWHSPLFLAVLFCLIILFSYNILGLISKERQTAQKRNIQLENIEVLHKREKDLSMNIAKLNTEEGIEDTIREKYQVVKEGEKEVIIVDEQEKKPEVDTTKKDHSFWGFIKRMFGADK
jgi:cell division protein FtsB